jgi:uncharacterized protein YlxP (DUF503 family)
MREEDTAHVALISIEFLIHHAASLKDKRSVAASVKNRIRARFNASVAEVAYLDEWQHCGLGVAMIGNDRRRLEQEVNALRQFLGEVRDIELLNVSLEWM